MLVFSLIWLIGQKTDMPVFLRNDKWMQNNAILEKQVADKNKDCLLCVSIGKKGILL